MREMTGGCKYRHLPPDHIDAIVDQMIRGKVDIMITDHMQIPISLVKRVGNLYFVANMPGCGKRCGELNPLCMDYNLNGM